MTKEVLIGVLFVILFVGIVSGFDYESNEIEDRYFEGDLIKGTVNISFSGDVATGIISSNLQGGLSLLTLLENNGFIEGIDYDCSTQGCVSDYKTVGEVDSLNLDSNGTKVGFKISGDEEVNMDDPSNGLSIDLSSVFGASCFQQVSIDVLADGERKFSNYKTTGDTCNVKYSGCFDSALSSGYTNRIIPTQDAFCEKIRLPAGPGYKVGATVINTTNKSGDLEMELYDSDEEYIGKCVLPEHIQTPEELGCVINHEGISEGEYYVCISSKNSESDYKIKSEISGDKCGIRENDIGEDSVIDYDIFGYSLEYDVVDFTLNEAQFLETQSISLKNYVGDYISDRYAGDCSNTNGCIIPLKISGRAQTLGFSNINLNHDSKQGGAVIDTLYELEEEEATVTSDYMEIDLEEANFTIPFGTNEDEFILYIDDVKVFEKDIEIDESFSFDVNPKIVLIGFDTEFEVSGVGNVTEVKWTFGDGERETTDGKKVFHKYTESGDFDLNVKVTNINGIEGERTFSVSVGDAEESAELLIAQTDKRLANISSDIKGFDNWIEKEISKDLDIAELNASLKKIKSDFELASEDDDFAEVVNDLLELDMPYSIAKSSGGSALISSGFNNLDLSYIEELSGKEADREQLENAIINWMEDNYNINIDFEVISAFSDSGRNDLVTKFKFEISPKLGNQINEDYLIFDYPVEGIVFKDDYREKGVSQGGATYIPLIGDEGRTIEFLVGEKIGISSLGTYISPDITSLGNLQSIEIIERDSGFRWGRFLFWLGVLIVVLLVVYIALQEWYKRRYEGHLFGNKDELYNLINFVFNGRGSGLGDSDLRRKLSKSGWKGEQIKYAVRKLEGKRTGMWEIPIFGFFERSRVKKEIAKRQHASTGKFINSPRV